MKTLVFALLKTILSSALCLLIFVSVSPTFGQTTWTLFNPAPSVIRDIEQVQVATSPKAYQIFAVGDDGLVQKMNSEGGAWTVINTGVTTDFKSFSAIDRFTFWVAGQDKVLRTTNGGSTWSSTTIAGLPTLNSISMFDINVGWVVGASGKIFKTTNGGATWTAQTSNTTNTLHKVMAQGQFDAIAVGANGTICRTNNGGTTWTVSTFGTNDLYAITAVNSELYAAGESGTIIRSIDGGSVWGAQTSGTTSNLLAIASYDVLGNKGFYACGNAGALLRSANGTAWSTVATGRTDNFLAIENIPSSPFNFYLATSTKGFMSTFGFASCTTPTTTMVSSNITACLGGDITITTASTGTITTRSLKKDGVAVNVNGNTTALGNVITLTNVQPSQTGTYLVEVTSPCGNASSASITITVNATPAQPSTITIDNPNPSQGIQYDLSVANIAGTTYAWNGGTGASITGSGNAVGVSWSTTGAKTVTVTPSNSCGIGTARTLALNVSASLATPTLFPADNATNVSISSNLTLTFSESFLSFIPGKVITIKRTADNSIFESYTLTSTNVTKVNGVVTINPTANFQESTGYYVQIEGGSITIPSPPFSGYTGILTTTAWNFTTTESIPPIITSYLPVDNATGVNVSSNLVATFSENVFPVATKMVTIKKLTDNSVVHSYVLPSTNVVISGNTVTINPSSDLVANTDYYVNMDVGAFEDAAGNDFAGLTNQSTWNFATAAAVDVTPPVISSLSPLDNATDVAVATNLIATFSENVTAVATKTVSIRRASDNSVFESYTLPSSNVVVSGTTVTINPTGSLANSVGYYVNMDIGALEDAAGNDFVGISNTTFWSFTTVAGGDVTPPTVVSFSPADNATGVSAASDFTVTFSENVQNVNGKVVQLRLIAGGVLIESITLPDTKVTVSGSIVTINPTSNLSASSDYYIGIEAGAFEDLAGNDFAGFLNNSTWNFTTAGPVPQNQTITFNALASKTFGDALFALTATSSSGLPVSYASSNTSVATIIGSTVTIVGVGSTTITASQAGNGSFNPATNVQQTLTVSKANQTITFGTLAARTFGDANFSLGATASSTLSVSYTSSNTAVATVSGNTVTIVGAGSTIITASQAGNTNYNAAADVQQTLTVNKANQTITFGALAARTFGDANFTLGATASSALSVSYASSNPAVATISGNSVTIVGAGSAIITVSQAGNTNYNAAANVQQTLAVNKANQIITFNALPGKQVGDAAFGLTATTSSGLALSYTSSNTTVATISGSTVTIVGAGSTTITASQAGNTNFNAATSVQQTLTVTNAAPAMAIQSLTPVDNAVDVDGSMNLAITFNQNIAIGSGTISIFRSDNDALITSLSNFSGDINISNATVTFNFPANIPAGTSVYINLSAGYFRSAVDGSNTFAGISNKTTWNFTIAKLDQTIAFGALTAKTFGDANFSLTASASSGLDLSYSSSNPAVATVSGTTVTVVGAGSTTITASQSGNATFNAATNVQQTLTINKANQTITFGALAAKTFGDASFTLGASASSGLAVSYSSSNTSVATISGNTVTIVGAGSTTITASQSGNTNFNAASSVIQSVTVNKANQTITFNALTAKAFGDASFTLGATSTAGLSVSYASSNTSIATVSGNTVTVVAAGSTTITASQAGNANFNAATSVPQILTVNKADQTISFSALASKTFGDANFTLDATASSALGISYSSNNTAVATISGNTVTIVGAGSTTITASQGGNANINSAPIVQQTLTVNKASQTISFAAIPAKVVGDAAFSLSASSSSGLAISFISSNTSVATVNGSTVTIVGAGTSTITALQGGNTNYNSAVADRVLTVSNPALQNQTITFNALPTKTFGDAAFTISASATSGLAVSFSSSNTSVATISGNTVAIVGAGSTTITAQQSGNGSFNAAPVVQQVLTVNKATQTLTFGTLFAKAFGDAPYSITATSTAGLAISFSSSNTAVAIVAGNTITIIGAGSTTITASQGGDANFQAAAAVGQSLTVNKANQTITFGSLVAKNLSDPPFSLNAAASSGLVVSYSSSNTSVATVSGNTVTIVGQGTTNITASQSGNSNYNAASNVIQSLTVSNSTSTRIISLSGNLTFGNVIVPNPSVKPLTISNAGNASLEITQINFPSGYTGDKTSGTIAPGSTLVVNVSFTPNAPKQYDGMITVTSNATAGISSINISGTGILVTAVEDDPAFTKPISVFPNPGKDIFTFEIAQLDNTVATVLDGSGRVAETLELIKIDKDKYQLNLTHLAQGVFYVQVFAQKNIKTIRLIKY